MLKSDPPNPPGIATQAKLKALVATSDAALSRIEHSALHQLHFEAVTARDDEELERRLRLDRPDLVILDASLPPGGAIVLCRRMRQDPSTAHLPLIVVTSGGDSTEKIQALEMGADDCIAQPLQVGELMAHIKALSRRTYPDLQNHRLRAGPIDMDMARWTLHVAGAPINLTKKEFRLLQVLLEAKGRALTRDQLLQMVWSRSGIHDLDTRTVDVHIGRLRHKLGAAGHQIITVRSVGFRFNILREWITDHPTG